MVISFSRLALALALAASTPSAQVALEPASVGRVVTGGRGGQPDGGSGTYGTPFYVEGRADLTAGSDKLTAALALGTAAQGDTSVVFGWHNERGEFGVTEVDVATRDTASVVIYNGGANRHDGVALARLADGRLVAALGGHSGGTKLVVSTAVGTFTGGSTIRDVPTTNNIMYVQVAVAEGVGAGTERVLIFGMRTEAPNSGENRDLVVHYSDDRGVSWSSETEVADAGESRVHATCRFQRTTARVLCVVLDQDPNRTSPDADGHLLALDPATLAWTHVDGTAVSLPYTFDGSARFYDASALGAGEIAYSADSYETGTNYGAGDRMYVVFRTTAYASGPNVFRYVWDGSSWTANDVETAVGAEINGQVTMVQGYQNELWAAHNTGSGRHLWRFYTADCGATWAVDSYGTMPDDEAWSGHTLLAVADAGHGGPTAVRVLSHDGSHTSETAFGGTLFLPVFVNQ